MKHFAFLLTVFAAFQLFAGLSNLTGTYRNGQVFLLWEESNIPANSKFSVWTSSKPITKENIKQAERVAHLIHPQSAYDWWKNKNSFVVSRSKQAKDEEIFAGAVADLDTKNGTVTGFVISDKGTPLNPKSGLHVHTPGKNQTGLRYFAVTRHDGTNEAVLDFVTVKSPVKVGVGKVNIIRMSGNITRKQTNGRALIVDLHGRGGGVGIDNKGRPRGTHIIFTDSTLGWREGLPLKFDIYVAGGVVRLNLNDRIWTGRKIDRSESPDSRDRVPAINTFWLGYNKNIAINNNKFGYDWDNYTERVILYIINWMHEELGIDKNRVYLNGGSMGGSAAVQLATHFPNVFAAAYAYVPIYSFTWERMPKYPKLQPSMARLQCAIGMFSDKDSVKMPNGIELRDYANGARNISRTAIDMPPIFATNGRRDMSIPWINNPPFYKAANDARQAFAVHWNNGAHTMTKEVPPIITIPELLRYRLNQSFPAFSNSTDNKNYGNGDPEDGDLIGWINRGMKWDNIVDTPDRFEMSLTAAHPDMKYPVTCDVTFRRRQQFKFPVGTKIAVEINGKKQETVIDQNGLLTVEKVTFPDAKPVRIVLKKK